MKRRLLNLLSVLSLLLCVASPAFWVRSYFAWDRFYFIGGTRTVMVQSFAGQLRFTHLRALPADGRWFAWKRDSVPSPTGWRAVRSLVDFTYGSSQDPRLWFIGFPHWVAAAAGAVLPAIRYRRHRRKRTPGRCAQCGYDLTGNVSGVCPECGTPAS